LGLLLVPAGLLASVVVLASANPGEWLDVAARLAGLGVAYALYLGVFVFLALAVSGWASSSRLSLVCLIGLWIALVLVLPRILADASRSWVPSASRREFDRGLDQELGTATRLAWRERFGVDEPFGSGVSLSQWGLGLRVHDQAGYGVMDRHFNALWDSYSHQQALQEWAGWLSPTIAMRAVSMGVAGTDFAEHRAFSTAAEAQRRRMQDVISADLIEHADGHGEQHFSYRAARDLWARIPPFEYEPAAASTALRRVFPGLVTLVVAFGISIVLAQVMASRRPVS